MLRRRRFLFFVTVVVGVVAATFAWQMYREQRRGPLAVAERAHHAEPPRAQTAVNEYTRALRQGDPRALLPTARILDHGVYQGPEPVRPNPQAAIGYYRQAAVLGDLREQAVARDRLVELGDRVFVNPPPRPQYVQPPPPPPLARQAAATDDVQALRAPRSDSQNVHDSSVVRAIKRALDKLPPSPISTEATLVQVRAALRSDDARKGLDLMERNTIPLSALNMREVEVLRKVWGRIQQEPAGSLERENMVEMLEKRLAESGQEASCASGRVGRVVDALSTFDDRVHLRPLWALRQEMLHKAGIIRDQRLPDDPRPLVDVLREEFRAAYVDSGLSTMNIVEAELASWGAHLE
jgi:hypothetical protein